jgi:hypothetical protein
MKQQLQQLAAFLILCFGIMAIFLLTGAAGNKVINGYWYLAGMAVSVAGLYWDSKWIDKHFINGVWI